MTEKELLNPTFIIDQEPSGIIYRAYLPFFRENVSNFKTDDQGRRYRLVEGAIIVDRRAIQEQMGWTDLDVSDHFTTLWDVDGFLTDVRKINFDFRHNSISTGAVGERSWVVDDYEIQIDDKVLKVPARMLSVRVYEDNEIRIKGKNGETINDGNLLANIENGRVFTWSVEFKPVRQMTTRSGLTLFKTYHTPRISFLDVTQGIPDAGGFTLRSYLKDDLINYQNNMSITIENIKSAVEAGELNKEELRALLSDPDTSETISEKQQRDINVEANSQNPTSPEQNNTSDTNTPDTNADEEISDEEMRSYIKEVKRAFGDTPSLINEKVDQAMRMCEDLKKRVDSMNNQPEQKELSDEEKENIEAQEIAKRALNSDLTDEIPKKVTSKAGDAIRSLGKEDTEKDKTSERLKKEKEYSLYRRAKGFYNLSNI